jgi:rhomboid family GlyGly-CTERM serine protease
MSMKSLFVFRRASDPVQAPCGTRGLTGLGTVLMAVSLGIQLMGQPAVNWLRYERKAVLAGQAWRLLTCHLAHLGWAHLLINTVALALLTSLLGKQQRASDWWLVALTSAVAIGGGLLLFNPSVAWYMGLSGVVHGLFAAGCLALLRRHPTVAALALFALAGKLAWEQIHPVVAAREALIGGPVIVHAHLYGAAGGLLGGLAIHCRPMARAIRRLSGKRGQVV